MNLNNPQHIRIEDYNYNLPDEKIAKYPLERRDESKLLVYNNSQIKEDIFSSIPSYLPDDSLIIYNNTKVIQARLYFQKATGANIEIFCLEPYEPKDYSQIFQQTQSCSWICLIGNSKKWKEGILYKKITIEGKIIQLQAEKKQTAGDSYVIEFRWDNTSLTFADLLETAGELPIPPYLNRETQEADKKTYQTVYSKIKGSVAAPTAGLHFTPEVFYNLEKKRIKTEQITLHVGAGTFKPVKSDTIENHIMHSEFISVSKKSLLNLLNHQGKVIAVGTTTVRTLESLYYIGVMLETDKTPLSLKVSQWQPYQDNNQINPKKAIKNIIKYLEKQNLDSLLTETQIIIAPGYKFKMVDGIITNFHQPKSTLLLLVSAFVGDKEWKKIYEYALTHSFRFLSYGDSSLLMRR